jgi:hypothetical protein
LEECKHISLIGAGDTHPEAFLHLLEEILGDEACVGAVLPLRLEPQPIELEDAHLIATNDAYHTSQQLRLILSNAATCVVLCTMVVGSLECRFGTAMCAFATHLSRAGYLLKIFLNDCEVFKPVLVVSLAVDKASRVEAGLSYGLRAKHLSLVRVVHRVLFAELPFLSLRINLQRPESFLIVNGAIFLETVEKNLLDLWFLKVDVEAIFEDLEEHLGFHCAQVFYKLIR